MYSPQTNTDGNIRSPTSESNQSPLASPSAADSQASSVIGALGVAFGVVSNNDMNEPARTFAALIGRMPQPVREAGALAMA